MTQMYMLNNLKAFCSAVVGLELKGFFRSSEEAEEDQGIPNPLLIGGLWNPKPQTYPKPSTPEPKP